MARVPPPFDSPLWDRCTDPDCEVAFAYGPDEQHFHHRPTPAGRAGTGPDLEQARAGTLRNVGIIGAPDAGSTTLADRMAQARATGWWGMVCWNGLSTEQQHRLLTIGNLPWGYRPQGFCTNGAAVGIETANDVAPGPRFYCRRCAIEYLEVDDE